MTRETVLIENKKARLRFKILETFSAGLELSGAEAKALRFKMGSLEGARVVVRGGQAYLTGMHIPPYQEGNTPQSYDPERSRRLLLKKSEIALLSDTEEAKGLTIVPLEVYNSRYVKVRIAVVRGKGKADKREDLEKRTVARDTARTLKARRPA